MSVATLGCCRSAIADLYNYINLKIKEEAVIGMSDISSGYKRLVADKNEVEEGKSPIIVLL